VIFERLTMRHVFLDWENISKTILLKNFPGLSMFPRTVLVSKVFKGRLRDVKPYLKVGHKGE
jgi:hypothetical protein